MMRTTLTLEPDLAARLRSLATERGVSFKEIVNATLRRGLTDPAAEPEPYRVPTYPMGVRAGVDLDKALQLAGELEDAELVRKLELRK